MNLTEKNTILITGGGSGLGRGLATAFQQAGQKVIVAGRRGEVLSAVADANPGMECLVVDVSNAGQIEHFAQTVTTKYPDLNVLINMAGIMRPENLVEGADWAVMQQTIATNFTAPLQLTAALLPHLLTKSRATVMNVTSGLAFTPLALTPTYSATKAALHAWSLALRYQLKDTSVEVIELAPPYVQTELMGARQASDPRAMKLDDFVAEVMELLQVQPMHREVLVKNVHPQRFAGDFNAQKFHEFFESFNDAMSGH